MNQRFFLEVLDGRINCEEESASFTLESENDGTSSSPLGVAVCLTIQHCGHQESSINSLTEFHTSCFWESLLGWQMDHLLYQWTWNKIFINTRAWKQPIGLDDDYNNNNNNNIHLNITRVYCFYIETMRHITCSMWLIMKTYFYVSQ